MTETPDATAAADHYAGIADGYERLWNPQRMAYVLGENKPKDKSAGPECPFCRIQEQSDEDALIVARGEHVFVVLNLYPYNSGHVLVCPYRHVADYTDLTADESRELTTYTQQCMRVIRHVANPHGFNLGMNQGDAAGAGIAGHLHQHVVPRWGGDANFFPIIARTKALPELLNDTRARLAAAWEELDIPC